MNENGKSPAPSWQPLAYAVILILGVYIGLQTGGGSSNGMNMVGPRSALNGVLDRVREVLECADRDCLLRWVA